MSLVSLVLIIIGLAAVFLVWRSLQPVAGVVLPKDDPLMRAAKAEARATLHQFWAAFEAGDSRNSEFALKFDLSSGAVDSELIWALDIELSQGRIFGVLGNPPRDRRYAEGDRVEIDPVHIVDWCYFRDGVAQGHFTIKAMFIHMPPKTVAEGKAALGWV
jgi:uncharacterized protein YegJ (DUF2314 family)